MAGDLPAVYLEKIDDMGTDMNWYQPFFTSDSARFGFTV
jgi:hypothetical protein